MSFYKHSYFRFHNFGTNLLTPIVHIVLSFFLNLYLPFIHIYQYEVMLNFISFMLFVHLAIRFFKINIVPISIHCIYYPKM